MGWLDRRREKKEAATQARANLILLEARAEWESDVAELREHLETAREWSGEPVPADSGFIGKAGEKALMACTGAWLIEPRRAPGQWQGGSQGASFRIMKGVSYRVGGTRGTYQQGAETPTPTDEGNLLITDQRVVFAGQKSSREWLFTKLIGVMHDPELPWSALQVSNRQRVSGFLYDEASANEVRFRLGLALALHAGTRDDYVAALEKELAELLAEEPRSAAGA